MTKIAIMAPSRTRRDWLEQILRAESSFHIAGVTATFPFLRSLMEVSIVDVTVIDLSTVLESEMPQDWLMDFLNSVPTVLLGVSADLSIFSEMLRSESGALLRTEASAEQIVRAIQSSAVGLLTLDSSLVPSPETEVSPEKLTPREVEVLRLLAEGLANRDIANRLNISEHTIKFHIRSIFGKLSAATRTEAVTRGLRAGLIEL
jgi:two-component system, NarL family, response regulator YdfI